MQEHSTPAVIELDPSDALSDAVLRNAEDDPDHVAFSRRSEGGWLPITAKEFATQVRQVAAGLIARGVEPGDRVAVLSRTRYEWTVCDYAIWTAGAVTVPVYETSSADQVEWILSDSGAVLAIVETPAHAATVASVRAKVPAVTDVLVIDEGGLDQLTAAGQSVPESDLETRRKTLGTASTATLVYTSGTTGRPKGVQLTHGNLLFDVRTTTVDLSRLFDPLTGSTLMFLPLAHIFGRIIQCGCVENRVRMGHSSDVKDLLGDLQAFQPTFLLSVPRVFEKVYNGAKAKAHADGKGRIFDAAEATAISWSKAQDTGGPGLRLRAQHGLFDRLVYARLRAAMGGKITYSVSGGAPLGERLGHFYRGMGISILEGYGLTETSAGATVNLPGAQKVGSVGRAIPGISIEIAEDGEILLRGGNVFSSYWHNEKATAEAITGEWFHTGDIGRVDEDGYLFITGRKKELIVTAGGKNVAPAPLEDVVRRSAVVSQCMVVGDQEPFIAALVTIDPESWPVWLNAHGKPVGTPLVDHLTDPELLADVQQAVDEANATVSKAEAIRKFAILPVDFTEAGGQLTPSMKVKRNVVAEQFAKDITGLYSGPKR